MFGVGTVHTGFWLGNLRERDSLEDQGIAGRIILKCILGKSVGRAWTGFIWLLIGKVVWGCCEHGNEPLGSIK